jgi:hypothetical protein
MATRLPDREIGDGSTACLFARDPGNAAFATVPVLHAYERDLDAQGCHVRLFRNDEWRIDQREESSYDTSNAFDRYFLRQVRGTAERPAEHQDAGDGSGVSDAAGNKLWRGNQAGFWKMVPLALVVDEIVRGIERRAEMVIIPKSSTIFAKAAGFFRPFMERLGFKENDIEESIKLASASGWHDKNAIERDRETR